MASLRNLDALERSSGVGGKIDLMVSGRSPGDAGAIEWMSAYENAVLRRFGYSRHRGCGRALVCPAFSLPDLFHAAVSAQRGPLGGRHRLRPRRIGPAAGSGRGVRPDGSTGSPDSPS